MTAGLVASLRLVVILDPAAAAGRDLPTIAASAVRGGATMLQVRAKDARGADLASLVRAVMAAAGGVPVLVNDRLDVALAAGAAGCHLGHDDVPLSAARTMVPAGFVLGGSAGDAGEARRAAQGGAHYLGIGPLHGTANKADAGAPIGIEGFRAVREAGGLPAVAIGGVTAADVAAVRAAGGAGVAVIGAVVGAADPEAAARELSER